MAGALADLHWCREDVVGVIGGGKNRPTDKIDIAVRCWHGALIAQGYPKADTDIVEAIPQNQIPFTQQGV